MKIKNNKLYNNHHALLRRIEQLKTTSAIARQQLISSVNELEAQLAPAKLVKHTLNSILAGAKIPLLTSRADLLAGGAWLIDKFLQEPRQGSYSIVAGIGRSIEISDLYYRPKTLLQKLLGIAFSSTRSLLKKSP